MVPTKLNPAPTALKKIGPEDTQKYIFSCPSSLSLSFAVWLVDDYTEKKPLGKVRVSLKEENVKVVKNLSGYYTFSNLPKGKYTLSVESELYFPVEMLVDTSSFSGSKEPVIEIFLKPRAMYPFPESATLLRGMLTSKPGFFEEVTIKATLMTTGQEIQEIPDEKGEFVLYFKALKGKADIIFEIKGETTEKTLPVSIEEGQSIYLGPISIF